MRKYKWVALISYTNNLVVVKTINARDIVKFIKKKGMKFSTSLDVVHSYVFPYILKNICNKDKQIVSIQINNYG